MNHHSHSSHELPRQREVQLLATPLPLPDESFASWLQRIAGSHQYSMLQLLQITGHRPERRDWDLPIPGEDYDRIIEMTGFSRLRKGNSAFELSVLCQKTEPARLLLNDARRPCSRWCVACIKSDVVPYLRWQWRLAVVRECWLHKTALSERCPWCEAPALLHVARLVPNAGGGRAGSLGHCDRCSLPLYDGEPIDVRYNRTSQQYIQVLLRVALGRSVLTQVGHISAAILGFVDVVELPEVQVLDRQNRTAETASMLMAHARAEQDRQKYCVAREKSGRWILNAETFTKEAACGSNVDKPYVHWSWRSGGRTRIKIAKAILAIRTEKRNGFFQGAER